MRPQPWVFACAVVVAGATFPRLAAGDEAPTFADRSTEAIEDADAASGFAFDPLAMACGIALAETDLAIGRSVALDFRGGAYRRAGRVWGVLGAGVLLYPLRPVFHGYYFEPRVMASRALSENLAAGGGGATALASTGWQWAWDYGLTLRLGAGLAASTGGFAANAPRFSRGHDDAGLALVAHTSLGWLW